MSIEPDLPQDDPRRAIDALIKTQLLFLDANQAAINANDARIKWLSASVFFLAIAILNHLFTAH